MRLMPDNGCGLYDWTFTIAGDFIKGVKGSVVVEEDNLLFDWNYASFKVDEWYSVGTLYSTASGQESFAFYENDYNKYVKLKWSGFKITGVTNNYVVTNGSKSGKVKDFTV
jgi:hypothetical protein